MIEGFYARSERDLYESRWAHGYGGHNMRPEEIILDQCIRGLIPYNSEHILDVGCGEGKLTWRHGTIGIELAFKAAQRAKSNLTTVIVADCARLPFRDQSFEGVICKEVLEHLEHPNACLKDAKRVVHKNGWVLLAVPNTVSLRRRLQMLLGWGFFDLHEHRQHYTVKSFRKFIEYDWCIIKLVGDISIPPILHHFLPLRIRAFIGYHVPTISEHLICLCTPRVRE